MRDIALQRRENGKFTFAWDSKGDLVWDERAVYPVFVTVFAHKGAWRWDDDQGVGTYLHKVTQDRLSTSSQLSAYAQDGLDQVKAQGAILSGSASAKRLRTGAWSLTLSWASAGRDPESRTLTLAAPSPETLAALATGQDMRDALIGAWPPGAAQVLDWDHDPGRLMAAIGSLFQICADQSENLRLELCPLTATANLTEWERAYGVSTTSIAVSGTRQARLDQITSRARENGATTFENIRSIVQPFLKYATPSEIVILETERDALRAAHTRPAVGLRSATAGSFSYSWTVYDTGVCNGGAQVDIDGDFTDLNATGATLTDPTGTSVNISPLGRGARAAFMAAALLPDAVLATQEPYGVWGSSDTDMWILSTDLNSGDANYLHWDGTALTAVVPPVSFNGGAIHGTAADDVWSVGSTGKIEHYNGTAWSDVTNASADDLHAVYAVSTTLAFAAGDAGTLLQWDGTSWTSVATGFVDRLTGVWSDSTGQTLFVCAGDPGAGDAATNGIIYKSTDGGATWATLIFNIPALLSLWAGGEHDVWCVGLSGSARHVGQGGTITSFTAPNTNTTLRGVWASASRTDPWSWGRANDVWAVGHDSVAGANKIMRWDGTQWYQFTAAPNQSPNAPYGVYVLPTGQVWIAIAANTVMHLAPTGQGLRLYYPQFDGAPVAGTWTLLVTTASTVRAYGAGLFVEGRGRVVGWDGTWYQGLSGAKFQWGVMVEDSKLGSGYNLDAARLAIQRITYARSIGNILRRSVGAGALPAGQFAAVPDDENTIPDQCIPG